jgi:putative cell wall-binding protein
MSLALIAIAIGPHREASAATDLLPDLRMAPLSSFRTEISGGERRLRFTTIMTNEGAGPIEVHGVRGTVSEPHMTTEQRVYDTDGALHLFDSRALMEYASDGHDHWHIQGVMLYQMWSDDGQTRRGTKVGFCFLDSRRMFGTTPHTYGMSTCGGRNDTDNLMGLSVGWGDEYPADFAFQWIDISTLPPGDYTVQARADEQDWYVETDEANNCAWSRVRITGSDGPVEILGEGLDCLAPPPSSARVERQYGTNRYETSAAASEDAFAPGVPVAYVATGRNFPDALAAGAAAGFQGGPIILVDSSFLPTLAVTELERLDPQRIVMVGGPAVVSDYVATLVARYQTGGGFTRLFGADRYATAAAISSNTFGPGVSTAYVTTGENWPDALAAVPHAARAGGPLLLTRGSTLPDSIAAELERLDPGRIVVVGGSAAVSDAVVAALDAYDTGGGVQRIGGVDRYDTAAMLSAFHHPTGAALAYVATGQNFPDALGAGPAAAARDAPTILVRGTLIPPASGAELDRLNPARIILLGGPAVITSSVEDALAAYAGP